ncbi:hypothetical protein EHS13_26340 [Paenibacillus psychroresistens]|uniref:GntR family transcriptional regulator n=1 Tax=Paenibacillus psychroresistens TaxID=1778678 RepID=A0A6B8RRP2_9BACL|nr:hypothetical protein [Paenibacillus psychroresistens]QGQ98153.1 hypothetical protein EHS13_26340 [Paenibacillus psychroresistens]
MKGTPLAKEGLLSQEQGRGTFITPRMVVHSLHILCSDQLTAPHEQAPLIVIGLLEHKLFDRLTTLYSTIITFQEEFTSNAATLLYFDDYLIGKHAAKILFEFKHEM